ncbi:acetyl-CoA synthetase-like protein [Mycena filopes]|nr:acetyl-CoA synthetase-like protein [Mycena filopes]
MSSRRILATPPLDGSILLHQMPDFHALHNPDHLFYAWKDPHSDEVHELTHLEFAWAVHRAAAAVRHLEKVQPVGVLALCDTVLYQALFVGLMKAGLVPYLLSPRNSATATAKLLADVDCHHVLATEFTLAPLLKEVKELLGQKNYEITVEEIPTTQSVFPAFVGAPSTQPFVDQLDNHELSSVAFYLHSSGSTGLPKTIPQTQRSILHWCAMQCMTDLRLHNPPLRIGATILPPFHTYGMYFQLLAPLTALVVINVAPPICPAPTELPFVASPMNALDHARATGCNGIGAIPALLETWASSPASVEFLKTLQVSWFSGGQLSKVVGTSLARAGVRLSNVYGATEMGAPVHIVPLAKDIDEGDWMYVRFDSRANIRWVPYGDDLSEAVVLSTEKHALTIPNGEAYATGDLFKKHPTKDLWKVVGRTDDVIVLSSGEKVVPGPAEDIISSSPLVSLCMMVGGGRDHVGLLVQPSILLALADEAAVANFRGGLHPLVEEANRLNPMFARIVPEMVFITDAGKPLLRNAKAGLGRKTSLAAFEVEIAAMYDDRRGDKTQSALPSGFTESGLSSWLVEQIRMISGKDVRPDRDLFEQGLDSVTIVSLRHRLVSALTSLEHASASQISADWIYQHPSIDAMVASVCSSPKGSSPPSIQSIIDKYSKLLSPRVAATEVVQPDSNVVVLTGSTGSLASQILALLIAREDVTAIYCLNRGAINGDSLLERQKRAFRKIGLDEGLVQSPKICLVLADSAAPKLGLPLDVVNALERSSFSIIHTAWPLDFNLTLPSFESHILSTVNLLNFGSSLPGFQGFYFTSSIGAVQGWVSDDPVPEIVVPEPELARGHGYGEGKYVIERLLKAAGTVNSASFRISQISGGPPLGAWPVPEWFPILVKSSLAMKLFPLFDGSVSWVPSDAVAHTILDFVFDSPSRPHSVINVAHPRPVPWNDIAAWIVEALSDSQIRQVPAEEWVAALRREHGLDSDGKRLHDLPALKLLPFFEALTSAQERAEVRHHHAFNLEHKAHPPSKFLPHLESVEYAQKRNEVGGFPTLSVSHPRLLNLSPLNRSDVRRWVTYWRENHFF